MIWHVRGCDCRSCMCHASLYNCFAPGIVIPGKVSIVVSDSQLAVKIVCVRCAMFAGFPRYCLRKQPKSCRKKCTRREKKLCAHRRSCVHNDMVGDGNVKLFLLNVFDRRKCLLAPLWGLPSAASFPRSKVSRLRLARFSK